MFTAVIAAYLALRLAAVTAIGVWLGYLASRVRGRPWTRRDAAFDAALGCGAAVVAFLVVTWIDTARGITQARDTLVSVIAVAVVVARHLIGRSGTRGVPGGAAPRG